MKKHGVILSVYTIIAALYIALSLILTAEKNEIFWTGFCMVILSMLFSAAVTVLSDRKNASSFPINISIVTFSIIYIAAVIVLNIFGGALFSTAINIFVSLHLFCLALYAVTIVLLFAVKNRIAKQSTAVNSKAFENQVLIYEFEKIKIKLTDLNCSSKTKAISLLDGLLDDLRFSAFGTNADVSDLDERLHNMAESLSSEIDNLIEIDSDDISTIEARVSDIKKVIKDRDMQIRLMSSGI